MRKSTLFSFLRATLVLSAALTVVAAQARERWSPAQANAWYDRQPWLVGSNFVPSSAINELEMWQQDSFDPQRIDTELGWAEQLGMNTMRVFLHDLLFDQDRKGFEQRINSFLTIAQKHHIRPVFVVFDSCWDPFPKLGPQHPPIPGIHNSGWVQSPGAIALADSAQHRRLEAYVKGIVGDFAADSRILAWDLWNEPDNDNGGATGAYGRFDPKNKAEIIARLLPQVFAWARSVNPSQPLTAGVWSGDWSSLDKMSEVARIEINESDVISFHNYSWPEDFEQRVMWLQQYNRPIICTEYMARGAGSTFDSILPVAKKHRVGAINWGLVAGKTQTWLPWDSWQHPYVLEEPTVWFHEVFRSDGKPYRQREADIIRSLTAATETTGRGN
jgi:hypothetical protein